jgi:hypothetical protein
VDALRDVLQRADRFVPGVALGESDETKLEQCDGRREPLRGARAEDLFWLVQRDDGGEVPVEQHPSQRQLAIGHRCQPKQARVLGGLLREVNELAAVRDGLTDGSGQVIEGRLDGRARHSAAGRRQAVYEHLAPAVVAQQRHVCRSIDFGEPFPERDEGRVQIRGRGERVGE